MAAKYVLDTHALVWYLEGNPRLGTKARKAIADPDNDLVLPIIALAEAAFIVERGRTSIPDVPALLTSVLADPRIDLHPLTWEIFQHSLLLTGLPEMHDRLIVGCALYLRSLGHRISLLTTDAAITAARAVPIVW